MTGILGFFVSRARSLKVVVKIAFRNLVRQFRRNLLLGIGIAVSMCILVVTASFTNGLTDILFNKIMVYMTGHISVQEYSYTTRRSDVIRDTPRFIEPVKKNVRGSSGSTWGGRVRPQHRQRQDRDVRPGRASRKTRISTARRSWSRATRGTSSSPTCSPGSSSTRTPPGTSTSE